MQNFERDLSDERLLEIVQSMDRVAKPLDARFEGDDDAINELMAELGMEPNIVSKLLVTGAVLRECVDRGIHVPRPNTSPSHNSSSVKP